MVFSLLFFTIIYLGKSLRSRLQSLYNRVCVDFYIQYKHSVRVGARLLSNTSVFISIDANVCTRIPLDLSIRCFRGENKFKSFTNYVFNHLVIKINNY